MKLISSAWATTALMAVQAMSWHMVAPFSPTTKATRQQTACTNNRPSVAFHSSKKRNPPVPFLAYENGRFPAGRLSLYVDDDTGAKAQVSASDKMTESAIIDTTKFAQVQGLANKDPSEVKTYCCSQEGVDPAVVKRMMRITKPRAYPLFMLEKATKIAEEMAGGLFRMANPGRVEQGQRRTKSGDEALPETKERIVILGTGWGAMSLLKDTELMNRYDATVISPRNFFLFTPMLAGASVGTVEARTIADPIREINDKANYIEATATSVDMEARTVTCEGVVCDDECTIEEFTVPYDRLVVAVGAQINTFGIPGVREHCEFLKQIEDARKIRRKIINLFERANYPGLTDEQRRKLLTFAVIGAGPTGVEFASELRDFIEQDGPKYYPGLLKHARIKLIDGSPTVLQPFDRSLQDAAIEALTRKITVDASKLANELDDSFDLTEIILEQKVKEVKKDAITLSDGSEVPYGMAVWAGGIGPLPITLDIIDALGDPQSCCQPVARGKIAVDPWLRAIGSGGRIFAMGDCACTQNQCLPSTAQVANQQGEYLGYLFSHGNFTAVYQDEALLPPTRDRNVRATLTESVAAFAMNDDEYVAPFQFLDMGILAYTGGSSALAQLQATPDERTRIKASGGLGFGLWRGVYFYKQASMRNRVLVFLDWMKSRVFGRDITQIE